MPPGPARRSAAATFAAATATMHGWLPRWLRWIPITWIGFAILGLTAFGIDMGALTLLHGGLGVPYPLAVTLGYALASVANFVLNRWLNFRAHGDIAKQSGKQLVVVVSNYLLWILAFSTVLETLGLQYQVSRIVAAAVEGMYLYLMMRLWVFPRKRSQDRADPEPAPTQPHGALL